MTALKTGQIQRTYVVADRGERPAVRGWFHLVAAALSAISSACLLYTSPSPRDRQKSRMPSSA